MAKAKVTLELELNEWKVIEKALDNYKGRLIHLMKSNEKGYEEYVKLVGEEKILDKLLMDFDIV